MGLFDNVHCRVTLPVEGANEHTFQTKSLPDPGLDTLEIRADGSLWRKDFDYHEWRELEFLGTLNFYSYENNVWLEFAADFVYGHLVPGTLRVITNGRRF